MEVPCYIRYYKGQCKQGHLEPQMGNCILPISIGKILYVKSYISKGHKGFRPSKMRGKKGISPSSGKKKLKVPNRGPLCGLRPTALISLSSHPLSVNVTPSHLSFCVFSSERWMFLYCLLPLPSSLSLTQTLSLSLSSPYLLSFSLGSSFSLFETICNRPPTTTHAFQTASKDAKVVGPSSPLFRCRHWWRWQGVRKSPLPGVASHPLATLAVVFGSQQVHLNLLVKMVPFVPNKSAQIVGTHFCAKNANFVSGSERSGSLFRGNDLEFILATKNAFQWYIICLCLKIFAKKSHFSKQSIKLTFKACLVLRAGPIGIQNQDLRTLPDSFRHQESNSSIRIGKWVSIENCIFRDKYYCLDLCEISITWYPELCFWNRAYP